MNQTQLEPTGYQKSQKDENQNAEVTNGEWNRWLALY